MMDCLSDPISFKNLADGVVTAETSGKADFAELARFGVSAFKTRQQRVINAITVADVTAAEIEFSAVVNKDLPNGWRAGQEIAFSGKSLFVLEAGRIVSIVDES